MKNRNIPYGYCYESGNVVIQPLERQVLFRIRDEYLGGASLLQIAQRLTAENVPYTPGSTAWSKAKIMRIVDDDRYLGEGNFPQIFDRATVEKLREKKASRSTQAAIDRSSGIYQLKVPVLCAACGSGLRRVQNCRCKCNQWWECDACGTKVKLEDAAFLYQLTALLNQIIADPELIPLPPRVATHALPLKYLESEIYFTLAEESFDGEILHNKLLERVRLRYEAIRNDRYIASKLRMVLSSQQLLEGFSPDLLHKVAAHLILSADGTLCLVLINGQRIGKEGKRYANYSAANA